MEVVIKAAHRRTRQTYGAERLQRELAEDGIRVGICRIKRKLGVKSFNELTQLRVVESYKILPNEAIIF